MHGTTSTGTSCTCSVRYRAESMTRRCCAVGSTSGSVLGAAANCGLRYSSPIAARVVRVGHHEPAPVLRVGTGGCLDREAQALEDHLAWHRTVEVESLAHGAGRRQQVVDRGEVHAAHVRTSSSSLAANRRYPIRGRSLLASNSLAALGSSPRGAWVSPHLARRLAQLLTTGSASVSASDTQRGCAPRPGTKSTSTTPGEPSSELAVAPA